MPEETIITRLRLLGGAAYAEGMTVAAAKTASLDTATTRLGRTAKTTGGLIDTVGQKVIRYGRNLGTAALVAGAAGVAIGLKFDASMERAEIGMQTLLKSATLAKRTTREVRDFALKAPLFGVEQMLTSAQQLIGAGYDAKGVTKTLTTFSDTLSALGRKPEDLQRMTYAFVQMMSKGQISAEELRGQLGEIFPAQKLLAKSMGMTSLELAKKMKQGAIKGKKPLIGLLKEMDKEYGNGTAKMAKSFDGMWANIKEQTKFTLGELVRPLFNFLEKDAFPAFQKFSEEVVGVISSKHMTDEAKWNRIKQLAEYHFGPLVDIIKRKVESADIPGKIGDALDAAIPIIMEKGTQLAGKAAGSFWTAWKHASLATKLFTGWLLLAKFNVFGTMATIAAEYFMRRWLAKMVASEGAAAAGSALGTKFGIAFLAKSSIYTLAAFAAYKMLTTDKKVTKDQISKARGGPTPGIKSRSPGHGTTAWGGRAGIAARRAAREQVPGRTPGRMSGPAMFAPGVVPGSLLDRPALPPTRLKGIIENRITVEVDGRQISKTVKRHQADLKARK